MFFDEAFQHTEKWISRTHPHHLTASRPPFGLKVVGSREYNNVIGNSMIDLERTKMETRVERSERIKKDLRQKFLGVPLFIVFYLLSILMFYSSNYYLKVTLSNNGYKEISQGITWFLTLSILFSSLVCYANLVFLILIVRSVFKLLFTVWIVLYIIFSELSSMDQNTLLIVCSVFYAYFEILSDINSYIFNKGDTKLHKILIKKDLLQNYSIPISIIIISLINFLVSYMLDDFIESM